METFLRRNFKVKGNIASIYKPDETKLTKLTKLIEGIDVQLWHKAPMKKIFLASGFTNTDGDFTIEFEVNSPVDYIVDGKISDVFIDAYYNGVLLNDKKDIDLLEGIVAYWKLDELSGTLAADASGNDHTATLLGSDLPAWGTGIINNGVVLNGGTDGSGDSCLSITASTDFNFGTGDFTYTFWIKSDNTTGEGFAIIDGGYPTADAFYCWFRIPNTFEVYSSSTLVYAKTLELFTGTWYFFTIRRIGDQLEVFVNNTSLGSETFSGAFNCAIPELLFGKYAGGGVNLQGTFDEIGIWKGRGLTNGEITFLYNSGEGRQYPFNS